MVAALWLVEIMPTQIADIWHALPETQHEPVRMFRWWLNDYGLNIHVLLISCLGC